MEDIDLKQKYMEFSNAAFIDTGIIFKYDSPNIRLNFFISI